MTPKICWITATYFLDVDIPIVPALQKENYQIDWHIVTTPSAVKDDEQMIAKTKCSNYQIHVNYSNIFSPQTFLFYRNILRQIKGGTYDIYYLDISGMPYFHFLVKYFLPINKCIIAAHNVSTPKGARYYLLAKIYMDFVVKTFSRFQVFSKNQYDVLSSKKKSSRILYAPLCLKNYGAPTIEKPTSPITFLFFGNIVEYKRLDILLRAVNHLVENGINNFKVLICGYCTESKWESQYKPLVNDDIVRCDIQRIPNDSIPNYFEQSHYFVMPYQDIAQSGAMTVAFCYNLPILASNLDTFKEFLNDEVDGYFFESGNSQSLARRMEYVIKNHNEIYDNLRKNQKHLIENILSDEVILNKYKKYFEFI